MKGLLFQEQQLEKLVGTEKNLTKKNLSRGVLMKKFFILLLLSVFAQSKPFTWDDDKSLSMVITEAFTNAPQNSKLLLNKKDVCLAIDTVIRKEGALILDTSSDEKAINTSIPVKIKKFERGDKDRKEVLDITFDKDVFKSKIYALLETKGVKTDNLEIIFGKDYSFPQDPIFLVEKTKSLTDLVQHSIRVDFTFENSEAKPENIFSMHYKAYDFTLKIKKNLMGRKPSENLYPGYQILVHTSKERPSAKFLTNINHAWVEMPHKLTPLANEGEFTLVLEAQPFILKAIEPKLFGENTVGLSCYIPKDGSTACNEKEGTIELKLEAKMPSNKFYLKTPTYEKDKVIFEIETVKTEKK
jgi:hypothetical protein